MNTTRRTSLIALAGAAAGIAIFAGVAAACAPAPEETTDTPPAQVVTWDQGTLECGTDAGVAVSVDPDGNNWAYCEPGMID